MLFTFSDYQIEVDVERTRAFYNSETSIPTSKQCSCDGCQNYDQAILTASPRVLTFLTSLGIDPCKPAEVYTLSDDREPDGRCHYGGWYHIVGTIIHKGRSNGYQPDSDYDFTVYFVDERLMMGWVEPDFPTPFLELSIDAILPYLLA